MKKMTVLATLVLAIITFHTASTVFAEPGLLPQASHIITPLDEANLKNNILSRLSDMTKSDAFMQFSTANIAITSKTGVTIGNNDYWVVRLGVENLPQVANNDAKNITMDIIVDPTGTYQIFDIQFVAKQGSLFAEAKREMNRVPHPAGFGTTLFNGKGTAEVLFISDPFCHYCQQEYKFLLQNKDKAKTVKVVHFPQIQPSSLIVSAYLMYAQENLKNDEYMEITNYVLSEMKPQSENMENAIKNGKQQPVMAMERDALSTLTKKFPASLKGKDEESFYYLLKGKYATLIEEERNRLKAIIPVSGTPVTVVDGAVVRGFNEPELKQLLTIQ